MEDIAVGKSYPNKIAGILLVMQGKDLLLVLFPPFL
uniref:Uncharacterized protein n=1 Tax=Rhizophora mucronata TaxID=61149 RepID=A0A2P2NZ00_RHIMU